MKKNTKKAFTLVELIVVIIILAILGTIAFISLQGYSSSARDSKRLSDIQNIKKSLELFSINTGKYPLPDNSGIATYSGDTLWIQGIVGDGVSTNLSRNLQFKPLDPLFNIEYTYSITNSQKEYELMSIYESDFVYNVNLLNLSYALDKYKVKIDGNYNQLYVKTPNYIIPLPSIISSEDFSSGLVIDGIKIRSQIITGGDNILNIGLIESNTGKLNIKLSVFTGSISKDSSDNDKEYLANKIKGAYSGSSLSNQGIYKYILDISDSDELVKLINDIVLHGTTKIKVLTTSYDNCSSSSINGVTYDSILYNYGDIVHNSSLIGTGNTISITNGIKNYTGNISCIDGVASITSESELIICDNGYIEQSGVCVANNCLGTIVTNGVSNAISQSVSNTWTYNDVAGICTFVCDTNYTWNSSNCIADTKSVTCGGSIPQYASASTSSSYTQTWNGSSWTPTINWGENQALCDFNCNSGYSWNGVSCVLVINGSCGTDSGGEFYDSGEMSNLCYEGTVINFTDYGEGATFDWTCQGSNGGADAYGCYANHLSSGGTCDQPDIELMNGQVWSACNVGSSIASTDYNLSSGNLYQWDRNDSSSIFGESYWNKDWRDPILYSPSPSTPQQYNGINTWFIDSQGPCPFDRHVPTLEEMNSMIAQFPDISSMQSAMYFPLNGFLDATDAGLPVYGLGVWGDYWTSTPDELDTSNNHSYMLQFNPGGNIIEMRSEGRVYGVGVRCLRNY